MKFIGTNQQLRRLTALCLLIAVAESIAAGAIFAARPPAGLSEHAVQFAHFVLALLCLFGLERTYRRTERRPWLFFAAAILHMSFTAYPVSSSLDTIAAVIGAAAGAHWLLRINEMDARPYRTLFERLGPWPRYGLMFSLLGVVALELMLIRVLLGTWMVTRFPFMEQAAAPVLDPSWLRAAAPIALAMLSLLCALASRYRAVREAGDGLGVLRSWAFVVPLTAAAVQLLFAAFPSSMVAYVAATIASTTVIVAALAEIVLLAMMEFLFDFLY